MRKREIETILRAVNRFRTATGLEPLDDLKKGKTGDPRHCVLAKSLNHNCYVAGYIKWTNEEHVKAARKSFARLKDNGYYSSSHNSVSTPELFQKFISQFDRGDLPQYVKKT